MAKAALAPMVVVAQDPSVFTPTPPPLNAHSLMSGAAPILDSVLAPRTWAMTAQRGV
jgi:hypothetical protein